MVSIIKLVCYCISLNLLLPDDNAGGGPPSYVGAFVSPAARHPILNNISVKKTRTPPLIVLHSTLDKVDNTIAANNNEKNSFSPDPDPNDEDEDTSDAVNVVLVTGFESFNRDLYEEAGRLLPPECKVNLKGTLFCSDIWNTVEMMEDIFMICPYLVPVVVFAICLNFTRSNQMNIP